MAASTFLERVKNQGQLKDLDEARRATEVVYRTMRDVMTNEAVDHVAADLDQGSTPDQVEDLWTDLNPLVQFLSRVRPPLKIKPENFLVRLRQEANLPGADAETIITAVFAATKAELSEDRVQEVANYLPGEVCDLWQQA